VFSVLKVFRPGYHTVHEGDTILVSFTGNVMDGETVVTEGAVKEENKSVVLGDNDLPEGFDAAVLGKRVGETVKVTVTYPDTAAEAVAGKTVELSVKINDIEKTTFKEVNKDNVAVGKLGDTLKIDYEGILVGEDKPFDGGSATNYSLELGSGEFIPGYEDALIGAPVGVTVKLRLTFPEDYKTATLKGKEVDFTVTVNSISRVDEDALTLTLLNEYLKTSYQSMEEWEAEETENYKLSKVQELALANTTVLAYPKKEVTNYAENLVETYEMYAASYGYTLANYVKLMGYSNVEAFYDYAIAYAQQNAKAEMTLLLIAQKENITISEAELAAYLEENYEENGFASAKKFKKEIGEDVIRMVALCEKTAKQLRTWSILEDDTKAE
jgi:FKBP-type peptidyl-prolyl cis-trans isomerase (trigger factor)